MLLPLAMPLGQIMTSNDLRRTFAAGDKEAVMMLSPETVCGSEARQFVWSADGAYLVAARQAQDLRPTDLRAVVDGNVTPEMRAHAQLRTEVVVWGDASHKARTVLTLTGATDRIDELEAMPGSDRVLFVAEETVAGTGGAPDRHLESIVLLRPSTGELTRLNTREQGSPDVVGFQLSPLAPMGALMGFAQGGKGNAIRFFGPSGELGPAYPIAKQSYFTFDDKGAPGLFSVDRDGAKPVRTFQTIDPRTGMLGAASVKSRPFPERKAPAPPVDARFTTVTLPKGFAAPTITLSLPGGKPEEAGVVTTDGEDPKVSPAMDAVAYVSGGSLVVRPFAKVPRKAYEDALLARAKSEALAKAKQVGLGLIMYAGDMDDTLPGRGVDLRSTIGPYLMNNGLLDGFTYTFKGGKQTEIEDVAGTEMGFVNGPGGRAVVYTDGHAKWIPNAP